MSFFEKLFQTGPTLDLEDLKARGAKIIDVRSPGEYSRGHADGTVNIPMQNIDQHFSKLEKESVPLIFICASGNRSGQVVNYLKKKGLEDIYNGGSWLNFR